MPQGIEAEKARPKKTRRERVAPGLFFDGRKRFS
jgi:hypothetical protein